MLKQLLRTAAVGFAIVALGALMPGVPEAFAASTKVIAVVVDFGSSSKQASLSRCVRVSMNATDADVVNDLLVAQGDEGLRWASSGLLCGVDGYPKTGCGVSVSGGGYAYWAYFHGTEKGWTYASDGPAEVIATKNQAVGLRYEVKGTGGASDQPPTVLAGNALQCSRGILDAKNLPNAPQSKSAWMAALVGGGLLLMLIPAAIVVLRIRSREN